LATTEARDAGVIAHFAAAVRPTPSALLDELTQQIDALLQRGCQRLKMLVAKHHRVAPAHSTVHANLARHLDYLQHLINETEEEVYTLIHTSPAWHARDDL